MGHVSTPFPSPRSTLREDLAASLAEKRRRRYTVIGYLFGVGLLIVGFIAGSIISLWF